MTEKFIRNEWGDSGLRKIGRISTNPNDICGTQDLYDLFQSFEDRIEELEDRIEELEEIDQDHIERFFSVKLNEVIKMYKMSGMTAESEMRENMITTVTDKVTDKLNKDNRLNHFDTMTYNMQSAIEKIEIGIDIAINDLQKEDEALRADINYLREKILPKEEKPKRNFEILFANDEVVLVRLETKNDFTCPEGYMMLTHPTKNLDEDLDGYAGCYSIEEFNEALKKFKDDQ